MKRCHACLKGLEIRTPVGRREICSFCGSDLHCCLNCVFHATGAYNECREHQAERVIEKGQSNFCDFFVFLEMPRQTAKEMILESLKKQR